MHETRLFWVVPGERFRQQCSCRQYFKIRWGFYTKVKVSWLRAFLWSMSQTSCDRGNSCRARTHEKNSGETVRRLGTIIQSIFCSQSGAGTDPLGYLGIVQWVSVPRGSFVRTWKLSSAFSLLTRLTAPGYTGVYCMRKVWNVGLPVIPLGVRRSNFITSVLCIYIS